MMGKIIVRAPKTNEMIEPFEWNGEIYFLSPGQIIIIQKCPKCNNPRSVFSPLFNMCDNCINKEMEKINSNRTHPMCYCDFKILNENKNRTPGRPEGY